MSKARYRVVDGTTRKVKKRYRVIDGVTRKVKKRYRVVANFVPRDLPEGFTQVEYIESSGTQYINTGFYPNNLSSCEAVMSFLAISSTNCGLFGAAGSSYKETAFEVYYQGELVNVGFGNTQLRPNATIAAGDIVKTRISQSAREVYINGVLSYSDVPATETFTCPVPLVTHALNRSVGIQCQSASRLYEFRLWDDGQFVRDYVPCINASGEAGLYDMVSGAFFGNAGTGAFIAGPTLRMVTRLCYTSEVFGGYTGTYTTSEVTGTDGKKYTLYTLTSSGTLTLADDVQYWMCGGGRNGSAASGTGQSSLRAGGGAGGGRVKSGELSAGKFVITIGSRAAASKIVQNGTTLATAATASTVSSNYAGGNGGSGGGEGGAGWEGSSAAGTGDGLSTLPFGITALSAHCAGGAGGSANARTGSARYSYGGKGGSNGSNGNSCAVYTGEVGQIGGRDGGEKGGGRGGGANFSSASANNGGAASFYGGGGGGGGAYYGSTPYLGAGGSGYQGVMYLLIPA